MNITKDKFNDMLAKADAVRIAGESVDNDSRQGLYFVLNTGMTHDLIFVGRDVKNNKNIIETL